MPLTPPSRDARGVVIPHDHPEIAADDKAIRRISPEFHIVSNEDGARKVSTMAFQPSTDAYSGLSIDLEKQIIEADLDPKVFVTSPQFVGSVWFAVRAIRAEGLQVGSDPRPDNPHHGEVWGSFTKGKKRKLLSLAEWYVAINGVTL